MDSKHRGHIKRAQRDLDVFEIDPDTYIGFYRINVKATGKKSHTPLGVAFDLLKAAQNRTPSQAVILAARKKSDGPASRKIVPLDAAVAILMDDTRAYLWGVTYRRVLPGQSENKPNADAIKLLILKAAEYAAERELIFDTDGLRNEGSEHLYRDILKFTEVEPLDVFERRTVVVRLFQAAKPLAVRAGAYMRSGESLLSRLTGSKKMRP